MTLPGLPEPAGGAGRERRRGRGAMAVVVSLLLLVGLALVADRATAAWAAQRFEQAMTEQVAAVEPDVDIHGFPFLTQLAGGRLRDVAVSADSVTFDGLTLADLSGTAQGVPTSGDGRIETFTGTALVPTTTLQTLLTRELENQGLDALAQTLAISSSTGVVSLEADLGLVVLGVDLVPLASDREIVLDVAALRIGDATIEPSDIPFGLGDQLLEQLGALTLDLGQLPDGIVLTDLEIVDGGALLSIAGTDVDLARF